MPIALIAAAVIPSLVLMWWFDRRDVNPEPRRLLWGTAALGMASVIPVLIAASVLGKISALSHEPASRGILVAFFNAALPEEFFKLLVVMLFAFRRREFDEPMDGVVYGVAASLGFATVENVLYVSRGGLGVAVARAVSSVPAHALFGAVMGLHLGRAKFDPQRAARHKVQALLWPVLLHFLYDAPLIAAQLSARAGRLEEFPQRTLLLVPAVLIFGYPWVHRNVAGLRARQLAAAQDTPEPRPKEGS